MPNETEGPYKAPSGMDINDTDELKTSDLIPDIDPSTEPEDLATVEPLPEAWSKERRRPSPENGETITDDEIVNALGHKFTLTLSEGVLNKLMNSPSMKDVRKKLIEMSNNNLGVVYDKDEELAGE